MFLETQDFLGSSAFYWCQHLDAEPANRLPSVAKGHAPPDRSQSQNSIRILETQTQEGVKIQTSNKTSDPRNFRTEFLTILLTG
jgi:hypothetical protein